MFDPSFFELIVICVVALLVLGPDKLPGAIKTMGLWIGRLRRSFNNIKREIEQEVGADEIRRQLRNEAIMEKFNSTKNQVTQSIQSVKDEAEAVKNDLNLKKEITGLGDKTEPTKTGAGTSDEETDPIEKLATNDPTARVIKDESGEKDKPSGSTSSSSPITSPTSPSTTPTAAATTPMAAAPASPKEGASTDSKPAPSPDNNTNTKDHQDKTGA